MSFSIQNDGNRNAGVTDAEKTLRLIAALPAPEGVADRVKFRLDAAPRQSSVISWPTPTTATRLMQRAAMRAVSAAAIVLVVAGGAWEVYSHIQIAPEPAAVAAPPLSEGSRGLSTAGAMRKPQTLEGPVISVPANVNQKSHETNKEMAPKAHGATPRKNQSPEVDRR